MLIFQCAAATLLAATLLSVLDGSQLALPRAATPIVDGTAAEDEWKAALRSTQRDTTLLLLHDGEDIYAAVKSPVIAITSIYVARGDKLKILHASAAIGEAVYRRDAAGEWRRFELKEDAYLRRLFGERVLPIFDAALTGYPPRMRKRPGGTG